MVTVKCAPWFVDDKFLLIGDAAHGIVPFFGQGMNCGFEDCAILSEKLSHYRGQGWPPWREIFAEFSRERKPDADAIADMALENFIEMRDKVADRRFLLEREVESVLQRAFPDKYRSRYSLVTFSRVPYRAALQAGVIDNGLLAELCRGIERADQVDLSRAQKLIEQRLAPLLKEILPKE
jgi:kynurenine 3-monooxygenase